MWSHETGKAAGASLGRPSSTRERERRACLAFLLPTTWPRHNGRRREEARAETSEIAPGWVGQIEAAESTVWRDCSSVHATSQFVGAMRPAGSRANGDNSGVQISPVFGCGRLLAVNIARRESREDNGLLAAKPRLT